LENDKKSPQKPFKGENKVEKQAKYTFENIGMPIKEKKETKYGTIYIVNSSIKEDFPGKIEKSLTDIIEDRRK